MKLKSLHDALAAGEASGQPTAFDFEAFTARKRAEAETVAAIHRGLADMEAGQVTPHDEVMREIDETIACLSDRQER